jgi:hypothetical protein
MRDYFKLKTWLILFVVFYLSVSLGIAIFCANINLAPKIALAGTGDNLHGFAWSDLYGWISFNSTNCDINGNGVIDSPGDDSRPVGCQGVGTTVPNYGVNVNPATGDFSGYAWSSNAGWIDFSPDEPYPLSGPAYSAKLNFGTGNVTGWAKVVALGDEGWIKMRKEPGDSGGDYSVTVSSNDFHGWAWNGNDDDSGVGWISFHCGDTGAVACATSEYYVWMDSLNSAPTATDLTASHNSNNLICNNGFSAIEMHLNWVFDDAEDGNAQTAYQILIDTDPSFASPFDTGKIDEDEGQAQAYSISSPTLAYGTFFYWRVIVWDSSDVSSYADGSFTTYQHDFPHVDFTYLPASPSKEETIRFMEDGAYYWTNPTTQQPVNDSHLTWTFTDYSIEEGNITASSTVFVKFNNTGLKPATLRITDDEGYYCEKTTNVNVRAKLPKWKEVK